jgi:hypothetical protein
MPAIEGLGSLQRALLSALDQMGVAVGLGTYNHQHSSASGSYFSDDGGSSSCSLQASGSGGSLNIHGTQILGWIARVTPASPPA